MGSAVTARRAALALAFALAVGAAPACRDSAVPPRTERATPATVREIAVPSGGLALPLRDGSVRFAVIGDPGRGDPRQYEVARQMAAWRSSSS